jgi:hypothetical protein
MTSTMALPMAMTWVLGLDMDTPVLAGKSVERLAAFIRSWKLS